MFNGNSLVLVIASKVLVYAYIYHKCHSGVEILNINFHNILIDHETTYDS